MLVSIVIWGAISAALGSWIYSTLGWAAVYGVPIFFAPAVVFGLQYNYFSTSESRWILNWEFWRKDVKYRQMTVWGIPIWWREPIETRNLVLPNLTVEDVKSVIGRLAPIVLIPVVNAARLPSARKK